MFPFYTRVPIALCAAAALWLAACSGSTSSSQNTAGSVVKIGIDLPTSGGDASVGLSTQQGALLAIEQAQKNFPAGFALQAYPLDDAVQGVHNPQQGAANVRSFASDDAVMAVVGPYNSNVAAAEIPVTNAAALAQIGPSVVSEGLTIGADAKALRRANPDTNTFFRVCTTDSRQGSALAQFARKLHYKSVYVIDDNETYGLDLANRFEADFKQLGGTVMGHDHIAKNTQDFKALLIKVAATKPDVIFYGGVTSTGGGLIRKQMSGAGMEKTPYLGGDGIADLATVAGPLSDGTYYTVAAPNALKLPSAQSFVKAYAARYHSAIGPYSANAYAAAQVAIAGIERAFKSNGNKMPTRAQVVAAIANAPDVATPIGPIAFDKQGDVQNPVLSLYGFKNGSPYFIDQLNLKTR
ncbi:MAG: branched-chain amino acid ABC transporter substrate-binding protein [Candidatus Eremiobacteraeota bacterium]|nr:branched-chain amino acid ABC transporter substrate-binding protein [Candidatus Eremiobacteraeota bacterium]